MRLAYTTTFDATNAHEWSGTPFHMSHALCEAQIDLQHIGSLKRKLPPFFKAKQIWRKYFSHVRESPRFNITAAQHYSKQIEARLKTLTVDAVLSPLINPIAYLECKQPIILWTDAVYAALVGFYPAFAHHSAHTIQQGNAITSACLQRVKLAIFSSDWARRSAIEFYGIHPDKTKTILYGANLKTAPTRETIQTAITRRSHHTIQLLFLAKSWERKGGEKAVAVTRALHQAGIAVVLNIVGCTPSLLKPEPYIHCLGFISKKTEIGKNRLAQLLYDSHFLFLPAISDACPMVLAEANAFGLPCLTSNVGGITSVIKNEINGIIFPLDTPIEQYCTVIVNLCAQRKQYEALALSAYNEYCTRLNWPAAIQQFKQAVKEVL